MKIAAVQAESVWCDLEGSVDKTCALIKQAGDQNCNMIGFPEVFIPGFPFSIYTRGPDTEWVLKYQKNSLVVGSPQYNKIRQAVKNAGIWAVIGFSERDGSTLYLSQSFINPDGDVVHHRRKLKPTHVERYIFGDGQAEDIVASVTTSEGVVIGGLQCWEHLQPLLRYNHYKQGVQVHVAAWPYLATAGDGIANSSCQEISGDCITRFVAIEGGCFTMTCTGIISKEGARIMNIPDDFVSNAAVPTEGGGFAAIYAPDGRKLAQASDQFTDQLVTATIDLDDIHRHKQMADCIGHYSRPDLFSLNVTVEPMPRVKYSDGSHMKSIASQQPFMADLDK